MAFTKKRVAYPLIALCIAATIYFYPFLSSSITWMRNSHFRYENRAEVKLPFRWIIREITSKKTDFAPKETSIAFSKTQATFSTFESDTSLVVFSYGADFNPSDSMRAKILRNLGGPDMRGDQDSRTSPFRATGLICGQVRPELEDIEFFSCISPDFRYSLTFFGRRADAQEASEITKQVIR
jgi:hypothetical protein